MSRALRQNASVSAALVSTLLGGLLAIGGGMVGIGLNDRRERSRWLRDAQLRASTDLLSALQLLVRRMINVAYLAPRETVDQSSPAGAVARELDRTAEVSLSYHRGGVRGRSAARHISVTSSAAMERGGSRRRSGPRCQTRPVRAT
jgi:hypothetical protein